VNTKFIKNVITLSSATVLAQILSLSIIPILTRLYSPEQFGLMSLFISIGSVFVVLFTLRLEQAILVPKRNENAIAIACLALFLSLFFTLLFTVLCYFYLLAGGGGELGKLIYLVPLSAFLFSIYKVANNYNNRLGAYKKFAANTLIFSVSQLLLKLAFGFLGFTALGLVWAVLLGRFGTALYSFFHLEWDKYIRKQRKFFIVRLKFLFKRYKKFSTWLLSSDLINVLSIQSPFLFIAYLYGNEWVGYFGLAVSVSSIPLQFIGSSIGNVFRGEAAVLMKEKGCCDELFRALLFKLVVFLIPLFLTVYFLAPKIFSLGFGENWNNSGEIVQCLCLMFFFQFIARVFSYLYVLYDRQIENFCVQITLLTFVIVIFYMGNKYNNELLSVLTLYSFSYSLIYIFVIIRSYYFSKGVNDVSI
jgi:O-antigen/teichoic acid export membrane protein